MKSTLAGLRAVFFGGGCVVLPTAVAIWWMLLRLNPNVSSLADRGVLGLWVLVYHLLLALPPSLALGVHGTRQGWSTKRLSWGTAVAVVATLAALNLALRFPSIYGPLSGHREAFVTIPGLLGAAMAVALPFLAVRLFVLPSSGRRRRLGTSILVAILAVSTLLHWEEQDPPIDAAPLHTLGPFSEPRAGQARRMLFVGVDGLSWNVVLELARDGSLPYLTELLGRSAVAPLRTLDPSRSPSVWNSIATGRTPEEHGIHQFSTLRLRGLEQGLQRGPSLNFMNWWNGLNRFFAFASHRGWGEQAGLPSTTRQAPTLWELADLHGISAGQAGWWNTMPVSVPAAGGFRIHHLGTALGAIAPSELQSSLDMPKRQTGKIRPLSLAERRERARQKDAALLNAVHRLWTEPVPGAEEPVRWAFLYLRAVDTAQHLSWRGDRVWITGRHRTLVPEPVRRTYRWLDRQLQRLLSEVDDDTLVWIVSDHGFRFDGQQHHRSPAGVFALSGPGVAPGPLPRPVELYDIAPTILSVFGLPIPENLGGEFLEDAFLELVIESSAKTSEKSPPESPFKSPRWIPKRVEVDLCTDGDSQNPSPAQDSPTKDQENLEALRALGYVN